MADPADTLSVPLQESVLTLLAVDDKDGRIASGLLEPRVFDDTYREIAERILNFRKKNGTAPGKAHLDDVLDDILSNAKHKKQRQYMRILEGIFQQADSLNGPYILSRVDEFVRRQTLKSAILEAGQIYQAGQPDLLDNAERVLTKALKPRANSMNMGVRFSDTTKTFSFMDNVKADYLLGIDPLDARNMGPSFEQLLMFLGAKGIGKSWLCTHVTKQCMLQGANVLYITLEMSEDQVVQRLHQSFWAIAKRFERFKVAELELDKRDQVVDYALRRRKVRMSFEDPKVRRYIKIKMDKWGSRFDNLWVKGFPSGTLTIPKLHSYLDTLELHEKFIPHVILLDMPDLMHLDKRDVRISLGQTVVDFRGLCQERHIAGVAPTQTSKKGWDAFTVKASMVAEDASKFRTADKVGVLSQSPLEKQLGLMRMYVDKNRGDEDGFTVVITQSYRTGQFALDAARMHNDYLSVIQPKDEPDEEDADYVEE